MNKPPVIFLVLFGGIFLFVGLAIMISGLYEVGSSEDSSVWVLVAMGGLFASVGGGIIWTGFRTRVQAARLEASRQANPSEPWKWNEAWQERRIEHHPGWTAAGLWAFAIFWNAIVIVAVVVGWRQMFDQVSEQPAVLFFLLFPIVGVGVLIAAIRTTMQWRRFGTSAFVLNRVPVGLGRELEGVLELPNDVRDAEEVLVVLTCLRTTRSGKNTTTTALWNDEQRYPRTSMGSGPSGPTLAVRFVLPTDQPPTSVESGYPSVRWQVSVAASIAGVDFSAHYQVPVFRTNEPPIALNAGSTDATHLESARERGSGIVRRTIVRERTSDGASVWNYRPLRAPSGALFMTFFTLIWSGIIYILITQDVSEFLTIIFGFFEVVLVLGTVDVLVGRTTVTIDRQGMLVQSGPGVLLRTRRVAFADVGTFEIKSGMTIGTTMYHTIEVTAEDGKKVTVGTYLRSRAEAEEIAEEMREEVRRQK